MWGGGTCSPPLDSFGCRIERGINVFSFRSNVCFDKTFHYKKENKRKKIKLKLKKKVEEPFKSPETFNPKIRYKNYHNRNNFILRPKHTHTNQSNTTAAAEAITFFFLRSFVLFPFFYLLSKERVLSIYIRLFHRFMLFYPLPKR